LYRENVYLAYRNNMSENQDSIKQGAKVGILSGFLSRF
jgi:hypothetical protein